jgi:hypothetical protein
MGRQFAQAAPQRRFIMTDQRTRGEVDRQLPARDEIFLDHIAHFVSDREAARRALARAGFTPTPISIQVNPDPAGGAPKPTGTGNVTAMFARGYVEVLFKTADTPLGREFEAALARYPGLHLAAFAVADAGAAHRRLATAGFRMQPLVEMQRPVDTADGQGVAAFTIARVVPGEMAEGRIQILTHRTEDTVWQPRWLDHPNGARRLACLTIVAADVDEAAARFSRFTGRSAAPMAGGRVIALDRGRLEIVTVEAFRAAYPETAIPSLPFIGACAIEVEALAKAEAVLGAGGLAVRRAADRLITAFPSELGVGVWEFVQA